MQSPRWTTVQESEFPWEREALAHLRELLPDAEPFRAWANFEFIGDDGSINEVDLLVVSLHRIYLVEIKSPPGRVEGDAGTWRWTEGARTRSTDNPLLLANRKAKKLKSLLSHQQAMKRLRVPYVEAVVFLSHQDVQCALEGAARTGVYLRAGAARDGEPHVGELLTGAREMERGQSPPDRIDAALSRALARALDQAGIRATQRHRQVGDYVLDTLLTETDVFQDWEAKHVRFAKTLRRIRIYPRALQSAETTRAERLRAAEREFRLLDGVIHDGILRVEGFTEHERGPALVFEHPAGAERLDFFLQRLGARLTLKERLTLVRQVAETLQFAHARRLYHQSLTPQSVLVAEPDKDEREVKLYNWQAGHSELASDSASRLTVHDIVKMGLAGEAHGAVYLAPELYSVGALDRARLDVFSLGALAYHVISGEPPAASVEELHEKLVRGNGLLLSEVFDGAGEQLEALVQIATDPDSSGRPEIPEFLEELEKAFLEAERPEPDRFAHPLDALRDEELEGGFVVQQRLGKGSTAVALLVKRGGDEGVLKVALEPALNDRIHAEGEVLARLRHHNVVSLKDVVEVSGHAALFVEAAGTRGTEERPGSYTLAQRIREEGRLSLDLLQRFGEELLGVVDYLEQSGVSHRDLKPENIGIGQTPRGTLRLVLFDFSLSGTPSENIRAGTPPYLDPFLSLRKPPRWDPYAERFAAAMTLYEMAAGKLPVWGDGLSNPVLVDDEATLEVDLFDPSVRHELERFFRRALARDYRKRFDNAEEMRRAWARAFEQIDEPATVTTDTGGVDLDAALAGAGADTAVASLPLSPRVLNALERLGVNTLGELQALPRIRLFRNKGIGQRTVKDVRALWEKVVRHLSGAAAAAEPALAEQDPAVEPRLWSIDLILRRLLPRQGDSDEVAILRGLLGFAPLGGRAAPWPAQQDVAEGLSVPREEVRATVERARERWSKDGRGWMVPLRDDVAALVRKHGGVMTREELVSALLQARGSAARAEERGANAGAVAYAALEVEAAREGARFILYRGSEHLFVLATEALGEEFAAPPAARARFAEALGARADALAGADPLLVPERAVEALREVEAPAGEPALPQERLLRLAVAASHGAALSGRNELYPRGMPAARALKLGAGALLGPHKLPAETVRARIAGRYPAAEPLPERPALDALLEEAGLHLRWDAAKDAFTPPVGRASLVESSSEVSRRATTPHPPEDGAGVDEARAVERRLECVGPERRCLVLTVEPRRHGDAEEELLRRFGLQRVSLESLLLREMRAAAAAFGADWALVLQADAADRGSRDWRNLRRVVDRAVDGVVAALVAVERSALLLYPGLLARYERLDLFDRLRTACAAGQAPGFVVLIAADRQSAMPVIDRVPLPVVHASEWARLSEPWLRNEHRGRARALAAVD
jgi:serine/threonine protein kinase